MSALGNVSAVLASAVANGGTVAVAYPSGTSRNTLINSTGGRVAINNNDVYPQASSGAAVAFAFGASTITITNNSGVAWAAGSTLLASFGKSDVNGSYNVTVGTSEGQAASGNGRPARALQELTASAAVTPGAQIIELNHASVVVAATMNALDHPGLFIVRDTSASGTAAHTLTLSNGTWNGTNTIATLNAPGEALIVFFDAFGRGQVLENTGAVALS